MTTIYVAFDGKQFQNQGDCEFYEWKCAHTLLDRIEFYNANNVRLFNYVSETDYNETMKIIIPDEPSLKQFKDLVDYTGFISYEDITEVGTWVWDGKNFIKEENNVSGADDKQTDKNS